MLDFKVQDPSPSFLNKVAGLLLAHDLGSATVTISQHPRVAEHLADHVILPISDKDLLRVRRGETISLRKRYWFGWALALPTGLVSPLQQASAFVLAALNAFHYPVHARRALAQQDARRLLAAGVDGFQIDSEYEDFFLR
jgi:hypothetical protein